MKKLSEHYADYLLTVSLNRMVSDAIKGVGLSEFKKTSLFLSNERKESN